MFASLNYLIPRRLFLKTSRTEGAQAQRSLSNGERRWGFSARGLLLAGALLVMGLAAPPAGAQSNDNGPSMRFMQLGTGPMGGTYFPLGGVIANAISNPPGSVPCDRGGSCGIPGLITAAQTTSGTVYNIASVAQNPDYLGLAQADLAYWAYQGSGPFQGQAPLVTLRAVAKLFQEQVHLVVRKDAGITSLADLKGKKVSLGEPGSGTRVDAELILSAYGLETKDMTVLSLRPDLAADEVRQDRLDAFFFVGAPPVPALMGLAADETLVLLPLGGEAAEKLSAEHPYLITGAIPEDAYPGVPETPTLSVGAILVCSSALSDEFVYKLTESLLHPNNQRLLQGGHPAGRQISLQTAPQGVGIPLHPGAAQYYQDQKPAKAEDEDDAEPPKEGTSEETGPEETSPEAIGTGNTAEDATKDKADSTAAGATQ